MNETVSVVIAVCNGANYLRECLRSTLDQSAPPDEVIVVDDGSSDTSLDVARSFGAPVRTLSQANAGQAAALVAGMRLATGSLLAFNDHDDLWTRDKLALQRAALAADPQLDAVFGLTEQFVSPELGADDQARFAPPVAVMPGRLLQAALIRRRAFDRIGGLDPTLRGAGAADWIARMQTSGLANAMIDVVVHRRRLHPHNYGRTHVSERNRHLLGALRSQILRQRPAAKGD